MIKLALGLVLLATMVYSMVDNGGLYEHNTEEAKHGIPKYILWSNMDGTNNVVLKGGVVKSVDTYWAGLSAWNDAAQVAAAIKTTIDTGKIPYIQAYSFGDKGLRNNCGPAINFDTKMAQAIGKSLAFVNIETEWDTADVIAYMKTKAGKKCMNDRIDAWKKYAPKAVLTSSAGLWSPDEDYKFFADIAAKLHIRSNIEHIVSDSVDCTWRVSGGSFKGKSFEQALQVVDDIGAKQDKMARVWNANGPFFTADMGITACGWTTSGQARVIGKLVDNMCALVKTRGWRGMNLRNYSPAPEWRAMGNNNEGMFPWSTNVDAKAQIRRGLDLAIKIMKDMEKACAGVTAAPVTTSKAPVATVTRHTASNDYWIQVVINPSDKIKAVTASWNGANVTLNKSSWSASEYVGGTNGKSIPKGTQVKITVSQNVGEVVQTLAW